MNRKRAQKIAAMKAPTLDEMKALRSQNERLRLADPLLRATVAKYGGNVTLTTDDLRNIPAMDAHPLDGGGAVLQTRWVIPRGTAGQTIVAEAPPAPLPAPDASPAGLPVPTTARPAGR